MKELINIIDDMYNDLKTNSNEIIALQMSKYMKNLFPFFGIKKPQRLEIEWKYIQFFSKLNLYQIQELVKYLWNKPERECQYIAMVILEKNKKILDKNILDFLSELIVSKSWWDTVDYLASSPIAHIMKNDIQIRNKYIEKWMKSDNIWLQRTCLLFQLKYKTGTDYELLFSLSKKLSYSKEFFIQKAIGWALREYSKTNPFVVEDFIANNKLAPLSVREGLKIINKK